MRLPYVVPMRQTPEVLRVGDLVAVGPNPVWTHMHLIGIVVELPICKHAVGSPVAVKVLAQYTGSHNSFLLNLWSDSENSTLILLQRRCEAEHL